MNFLETRLAYKNEEKKTPPFSPKKMTAIKELKAIKNQTNNDLSNFKAEIEKRLQEYQKKLKELVAKRSNPKLTKRERNAAQAELVELVKRNQKLAEQEKRGLKIDSSNIIFSMNKFNREVKKQNSNRNNIYTINYSSVLDTIRAIALRTGTPLFADNVLKIVGRKAFKLSGKDFIKQRGNNPNITMSQLLKKTLTVTSVTQTSVTIKANNKTYSLNIPQ